MELLVEYLARFGHVIAGVVWIGMLYYFNFVQTEYFKEAEGDARVDAFSKLVPRALWWFRWGAMLTFLTGVILLGYKHSGLTPDITLGATMGTLMFLNVWLIIWPNQRIVIASNQAVAAGGEADPAALRQLQRPLWRLEPIRCSRSQCCTLWALVHTLRSTVASAPIPRLWALRWRLSRLWKSTPLSVSRVC